MNDPRNPQDPRFAATQFAPGTPDQQPQQPSYGQPAPAAQTQPHYGQASQPQQQNAYGQPNTANPYAQPNPYAPPGGNPYEQQQQAYGQPPAGYGAPQQPPGGFGYQQQQQGYGTPPPGAYSYPLAPAATNDAEIASSLKALSVLQYVYAGFTAIGALMVLLWVVIGGAMVMGSATGGGSDAAGEAGVGVLVIVMAIAMLVVFGGIAGLHILAARSLGQRRRHTLLLIVACLTMLSIPIGTALGIWMLVVLTKPEVKATFT